MNSLFGIPMDTLMAWMLGIFIVATFAVVCVAALNPLFFKMGIRNIPRRRAQTVLIVVGLMLSTVIVTSAFGTGDTLAYSVRSDIVGGIGYVDEAVAHTSGYSSQGAVYGLGPFAPDVVAKIQANVAANPSATASMPVLISPAPLQDLTSGQTKAASQLQAMPSTYPAKFGPLTTTGGATVTLGQLRPDEAYINQKAADTLSAHAGDTVVTYFQGARLQYRVRAVLADENLASGGLNAGMGIGGLVPALFVPMQRFAGLEPNVILISNKGDLTSGADNTDAVTDPLRALLANTQSVAAVQQLLTTSAGMAQVTKLIGDPAQAGAKSKLQELQTELAKPGQSDQLKILLSDPTVLSALRSIQDSTIAGPLNDNLASISDYTVMNVKKDGLSAADLIGSVFVSIFLIFGLFSIAAGIMLIFLIFVMLAAERRPEMGMARAVGTKRRHLVQQFLSEGYVYNLAAALIGIGLGLVVALGMAQVMASLFGSFDFSIQGHIEPRSLVVSFCLGALVTFITVIFSSYRASRLNIVAAIRDLPEEFGANKTMADAWRRSLKRLPRHPSQKLIRTFFTGAGLLIALTSIRAAHGLFSLGFVLVIVAIYFWPVVVALLARGFVLAAGGAALTVVGLNTTESAWWGIGNSLLVIGVAMLIRWALSFTQLRESVTNRIGYSLAGLLLVIYWLLPFDFWYRFGVPKLSGGIEMFFVSGILLVMGGVWTVMFNADLIAAGLQWLAGGLQRLTGRSGSLVPVVKMAVTYPMQQKVRTGLTLAMFSLVIFTLMVMSVLTRSASGSLVLNRDTGGYQIYGSPSMQGVALNNAAIIQSNPVLRKAIIASGGIGQEGVGVRQPGQADQSWQPNSANVVDDAYLNSTHFTLHGRALGYASDAAVWQTLLTKPGYAVVDGSLPEAPSSDGTMSGGGSFTIDGIKYDQTPFTPRTIEIRDSRTGTVMPLTVIGFLDINAGNLSDLTSGIYTGERTFTALGLPYVNPTTYVYRTAPGVDVHATALLLGKTFIDEGLDVKEAQKQFDDNQALSIGLDNLLEGFMALGLIVGIAALGVIAFRSVVERRQQIGMMRAIGFQQGMVRTAFLVESSFVAILGTLLGVVLGLALAYNLVASIATSDNSIAFSVPWPQLIIIVVLAYIASLITTYVPAWQASRIYPAQALRYE